jgi:hypothetical protein
VTVWLAAETVADGGDDQIQSGNGRQGRVRWVSWEEKGLDGRVAMPHRDKPVVAWALDCIVPAFICRADLKWNSATRGYSGRETA